MNVIFTKKLVLYLALFAVGLVFPNWVSAQYEAETQTVSRAQTLEHRLHSTPYKPQVMTLPSHGTAHWANGDNLLGELGDNTLFYTPSSNSFIGNDTLKVGYWQWTNFGPVFTQRFLYIKVVPSVVVANDDYAATDINQTIVVDVLQNDEGNSEVLTIKSPVLMENNGVASITANGQIAFTPADGFEGVANLNYIACDELNTCDLATVSICVFNFANPQNDTLQIITRMNTSEVVLLPVSDYTMTTSPSNGQYDTSGEVARYIPNQGFTGSDNFVFEKNINGSSVKKTVIVDVMELVAENAFAEDDYFATAMGTQMEGNVLSNDLGGSSLSSPIISVAPRHGTATMDYNGNLVYTPNSGFEGIERISYKVLPGAGMGGQQEEATAFIFVSNQEPIATTFELKTPKSTPLVIGYGVTIDYHGFNTTSNPRYGQVHLGDIDDDFLGYNISGDDLIVYVPQAGVTGYDEFEIEYCVTQFDCTPVKIKVEILDLDIPTNHFCVANECIWAGDTNNDGVVNMKDLLPIGLGMGEVGTDRENPDLSNWYGQYGEDWTEVISGLGLDIKYIDTDGDGVVSAIDTSAISDFYGNIHSILPETPTNLDNTPLFFGQPDTIPLVGPGAIIELPIMLGAAGYPALDAYGFTFDIDFSGSSDVIDLESIELEFSTDSWMAYNSPVLNMQREMVKGKVEAGYTRTNGVSASGYGLIGTVKFVVEDILDGFKLNDTQFSIQLNAAGMMNSAGQVSSLATDSYTFELDLSQKTASRPELIDETQVQLAPNPTSNWIRVDLYSQLEAAHIEVYNLAGQQVLTQANLNTNRTELNVSNLPNGMYFMQVHTTNGGVVHKKFEILK